MNCISCGRELVERDHEGVSVSACPDDCGVWVELTELAQVAQREDLPRDDSERAAELAQTGRGMGNVLEAVEREGARSCPQCGLKMRKVEYADSGIVLDRCGGHGAWLDSGELQRVEAFAEGFRRSLARFA